MKLLGRFLTFLLIAVIAAGPMPAQAAPAGLYGKVVNSLNKPIPGTQVVATQAGVTKGSAVTAADGTYAIPVVAGSYSVSYQPPTTADSKLQAYGISVPQKASMAVMLTKPTAGTVFLSGNVSFSNGMVPASDSTLYFAGFQGTVNAAKFFKFAPAAGSVGSYTLKTSSGTTFAARLYGQNSFAINQDTLANFAIPVTTQRIRVLTPDGKPVSGAIVEAGQGRFGTDIATMKAIEGLGTIKANWDNRGVTDVNGYVTLTAVQMAAPSDAGFQVTPPAAAKYERETFIKTTGVGDVVLGLTKPSGLFTGSVKDQNGSPLFKASVSLASTVFAETNAQGVFNKAAANGISGGYEISYQSGSEKGAYEYFILNRGEAGIISGTTTKNFVITRDNVSVTVLDPNGLPMANALVTLTGSNTYVPLGRMTLTPGSSAYTAYFKTKAFTNAKGVATLKALRYDATIDGFVDVVPAAGSEFAAKTQRIQVGDGAPVTVTLDRPTVTMSGVVQYSDGTPVVNGKLTYRSTVTGDLVSSTIAANGSYSMSIPKGGRGILEFECGGYGWRNVDAPLCVQFQTAAPANLTANIVKNLVVPTRQASISVVDHLGNPLAGVKINYDSSMTYSPCYEGVKLTDGTAAEFVKPFAKATTNSTGFASLSAVQSSVACDTSIHLDPGPNSRYEARDVLVDLNSGDDYVIVLSIPAPVIESVEFVTDIYGVTRGYVTGSNLLGTFEVKIGDAVVSTYAVSSSTRLTFIVPAGVSVSGQTLSIQHGGGTATYTIP